VYAYNGDASDNFQVYHPSSAAPAETAGWLRGLGAFPASTGLLQPDDASSARRPVRLRPSSRSVRITSPAAGSTLTSDTQLFQWSTGVGVASYPVERRHLPRAAADIYRGAADDRHLGRS
jgi:hypothetical protein